MEVSECVFGVKCFTKGCVNVKNALVKMRKCKEYLKIRKCVK